MSQRQIIPSAFVDDWVARLAGVVPAPRRALDLAMGRGRHALPLARAGYRTFGVDVSLDAVRDAMMTAAADGVIVRAWCADLTEHPLPTARFELVVVSRYLQRDLFPALRAAVARGGAIVYETFTTAQRALDTGPRSADHLLEPGELLREFQSFDVLFYEEIATPEAVARLVARRPI